MPKFKEERPNPGDLVRVRGKSGIPVYRMPEQAKAGWVMPGVVGLVISSSHKSPYNFYAYVLWSMPIVCGWTADGAMEKIT